MKKFFSVFLLAVMFIFIVPFIQGCGDDEEDNNDGFKPVYSIAYTVNGHEKTETSKCGVDYNNDEIYITKKEYDSSPRENRQDYQKIAGSLKNRKYICKWAEPKGETRYYKEAVMGVYESLGANNPAFCLSIKDDNLVRYQKYLISDNWLYRKFSIKGYYYTYVYVKVEDFTTITIKNTSGEKTYKVDTYEVDYLTGVTII